MVVIVITFGQRPCGGRNEQVVVNIRGIAVIIIISITITSILLLLLLIAL
jgi:hypothetical protein